MRRTLFIILFIFILFISPFVSVAAEQDEAVLAGGCFWCLEHDLEDINGVLSVESGYSGGSLLSPTYKQHKGHQEAVRVIYNPKKISYNDLLKNYLRNIDPFDNGGQFCDRGDSYLPIIFTKDESERELAMRNLKSASIELKEPITEIAVKVKALRKFWPAEDYHQDFAKRNKLKYNFYRLSCGRDTRLDEVWNEKARTSMEWSQ